MLVEALLVFTAVCIADICWTQYFIATNNKDATKAGIYSTLIVLVGAYITRSYVHDGLMIIPAAIGAFVGTAGTIIYQKKRGSDASK